MPQYRVNRLSLVENRLVQPGTIVEFDGEPGVNFDALDAEGQKRKDALAEKRRPKDANEMIGRGMAMGFAEAQKETAKTKAKDKGDADPADPPRIVQAAGDDALTTVGHSSVSQKSAGGVDAEHLLESDGKGGLVPQNPYSDAKPATKADSPDDGRPKGNGDLVSGLGTGDPVADAKARDASRDADRKAAAAKQSLKGAR